MSELKTDNLNNLDAEIAFSQQRSEELNNESVNSEESSESLVLSPGEMLKKIREELGYSEAKVADSLHMTARYVKALESGDYEILPGRTFVKGYFKAYATFLKADVEAVMACYLQYSSALDKTEASEAQVILAKKNYDQNRRWLICAAFIIIAVVGVSWWYK